MDRDSEEGLWEDPIIRGRFIKVTDLLVDFQVATLHYTSQYCTELDKVLVVHHQWKKAKILDP